MELLALTQNPTKVYLLQGDETKRSVEMRARTTLAVLHAANQLNATTHGTVAVFSLIGSDTEDNASLIRNVVSVAQRHGGAIAVADRNVGWQGQPNVIAIRGSITEAKGYLVNYLHACHRWLSDRPNVLAEIKQNLPELADAPDV